MSPEQVLFVKAAYAVEDVIPTWYADKEEILRAMLRDGGWHFTLPKILKLLDHEICVVPDEYNDYLIARKEQLLNDPYAMQILKEGGY